MEDADISTLKQADESAPDSALLAAAGPEPITATESSMETLTRALAHVQRLLEADCNIRD